VDPTFKKKFSDTNSFRLHYDQQNTLNPLVKSVFKSVHKHRRYLHFCERHVRSIRYAATRRLQLHAWPILCTGLRPVQLFLVSYLISIDPDGSASNSSNSSSKHARWSAQRAYNGQLLQLLRALPSGSIVPFVLSPVTMQQLNITPSLLHLRRPLLQQTRQRPVKHQRNFRLYFTTCSVHCRTSQWTGFLSPLTFHVPFLFSLQLPPSSPFFMSFPGLEKIMIFKSKNRIFFI